MRRQQSKTTTTTDNTRQHETTTRGKRTESKTKKKQGRKTDGGTIQFSSFRYWIEIIKRGGYDANAQPYYLENKEEKKT